METTMRLVKAIAAGLAALLVCALVLAYSVSYLDSPNQSVNSFGLTASGLVMLTGSIVVGAAFVILFGAPIFTIFASKGMAQWRYVLLLGAAPGLVALVFNWPLGLFFMAFGIPIAAFVRLVCGAGPNNSFKPSPLRGLGPTGTASGGPA